MGKTTKRFLYVLFALSFYSVNAKADITGLITNPGGSSGQSQFNNDFIFDGSQFVVYSTSTGELVTLTPPQGSISSLATYCSSATHVGRIMLSTNSVSGQWVYVCESSGNWVQQGGSGSGGVSVYPATSTILADAGVKSSTLSLTSLSPGVAHIVSGSSNVVTALVSLSTEVIGILPLTNMSPGATYYIQNVSSLQSGATFYVSSGTVTDIFRVGAIPGGPRFTFDPSSGDPILILKDSGSAAWAIRFNDNFSTDGNTVMSQSMGSTSWGIALASASGNGIFALSRFTINKADGLFTFQDHLSNTIFKVANSSVVIGLGNELTFNDADDSNFVSLQPPAVISANKAWTLPVTDGSFGQAWKTNGSGTLSVGLSSASSPGAQYTIPVTDANGSLEPSAWTILPSIIGLSNVAFGESFFATTVAGIGLGATLRFYDTDLSNQINFGEPSGGYTEDYRINYPATKLGQNQVWLSTGPTGSTVNLVNQTVIVSTNGLQSGTTFYVSSGTVTNIFVSTINFTDGSKLATAPEKEYWWPGAATMPLEATADSIAPIAISTGTNFDVMDGDFDSATDECRQVSFYVSTSTLIGVSTVTFMADWFSLTATSGNVGWYFKHNSGVTQGESWDQTPQVHASSFDSVQGTARQTTHTSWDISVSSLTWRGGDVVEGGFCRDANNGSDTMSGDAKVEGFWVRFKRQ